MSWFVYFRLYFLLLFEVQLLLESVKVLSLMLSFHSFPCLVLIHSVAFVLLPRQPQSALPHMKLMMVKYCENQHLYARV